MKAEISRFKGLGEMPAQELKATTLDPKRRKAMRVVIDLPAAARAPGFSGEYPAASMSVARESTLESGV